MMDLTTEKNIVLSLLSRSLGEDVIWFKIYTDESYNLILECRTDEHKFTISRIPDVDSGDKLRIFDDGRIYTIQTINDVDNLRNSLLKAIDFFSNDLVAFYDRKTTIDKTGVIITFIKYNSKNISILT